MALIKADSLQTKSLFADLFPIDPRVLDAITESMGVGGYDESKPIDVWGNIVIDGHTRLAAARKAGIEKVAAYQHHFEDEDEALRYAIANQRDRRNMTDADLMRCLEALDRRKQAGRPEKLAQDCANFGKSADDTATVLNVSPRKVEQARTVLKHAPQPVLAAVQSGEMTINGAYRETQERRRHERESQPSEQDDAPSLWTPTQAETPALRKTMYSVAEWEALAADERRTLIEAGQYEKPTSFNRTNDNVEWALWTWNPVTGCDHGCGYCYARDIANRFYPQLFVPTFIPDRLSAPHHMKVPKAAADNVGEKNVFVCSMADLFGKWVPQEWIEAVFEQARIAEDWNFLFLTKFPQRLAELHWPANAWCGTSVDTQARVSTAERAFRGVKAGVKWLSCEPLLERLTFTSLDMFDWVVIGGQSRSSGAPEFQPPWEWVEHLIRQARDAGCKVYLKPNLTSRPREYPTGAVEA